MRSWLSLTLVLLSISILVACSTVQTTQYKQRPTRPVLHSWTIEEPKGAVCFTKDDATALYMYIIALEQGYDQ